MKFRVLVLITEMIEEITGWLSVTQWIVVLLVLGLSAAVAIPLLI